MLWNKQDELVFANKFIRDFAERIGFEFIPGTKRIDWLGINLEKLQSTPKRRVLKSMLNEQSLIWITVLMEPILSFHLKEKMVRVSCNPVSLAP